MFHVNHTFSFTETFNFAFKSLNCCVGFQDYIYSFIKFRDQKKKKRKILADNSNISILCIYTYCLTISNTDNIDCFNLLKHVLKALNYIQKYPILNLELKNEEWSQKSACHNLEVTMQMLFCS